MKARFIAMRAAIFLLVPLFVLLLWAGITPPDSLFAHAYGEEGDYDKFEITRYVVEMTVGQKRVVEVKEDIYVNYFITRNGIIRDLPLDRGVRYGKISVLRDGASIPYSIRLDSSEVLSVYLGKEGMNLHGSFHYTIGYTMTVPALKEKGYLPLDVIGYDWQAAIKETTVIVHVPEGLIDSKVYSGPAGTKANVAGVQKTVEGNTVRLEAASLFLPQYSVTAGVTLDLSFEEGVLGVTTDLTWLWALLIGLAVILIALLNKLFWCKQPVLTSTVNFCAPDGMDPLQVGKLIDNSVDGEDLGAFVFWLAAEGHISIDFTQNDEDPKLLRRNPLPETAPPHRKQFYRGLFLNDTRSEVRVSELSNRFYITAQSVKHSVDGGVNGLYTKSSAVIIFLLGLLSVLALGLFSFLYAMRYVSGSYFYFFPFVGCLFSFAIPAVGSCIATQRRWKWKKGILLLLTLGTFIVGCLIGGFGWVLRSAAFSPFTFMVSCDCAALAGMIAGSCLKRTEEYSGILGQILGFRDFIAYTERDRIEFMLKTDPELYYRILPYAQVLGVTDAWTEKFEGLDMEPPAYMFYSGDLVFRIALFHSLTRNFARTAISKPTNRGGGYSGGFGGGFGGGGFGGGGGRSF